MNIKVFTRGFIVIYLSILWDKLRFSFGLASGDHSPLSAGSTTGDVQALEKDPVSDIPGSRQVFRPALLKRAFFHCRHSRPGLLDISFTTAPHLLYSIFVILVLNRTTRPPPNRLYNSMTCR